MCIVITIISLNCMAIIGCRNRSYIAIIPACYKHGHIIHTGILHIRACYIYGRVTYTACYIYGNVTYRACYIYGNVTSTSGYAITKVNSQRTARGKWVGLSCGSVSVVLGTLGH